VVVVRDECIDLSFEIAGQIIVLEQDGRAPCPLGGGLFRAYSKVVSLPPSLRWL